MSKRRLLVDRKADLNAVDKKRRTPLGQLKKSLGRWRDLDQILEYMELKGARVEWR